MKFDDNTRSLFNSVTEGHVPEKEMRFYIEMKWVTEADFDEIIKLSKHPKLQQIKILKDTNNKNALNSLFMADPKTKDIYKLLCG